MEASTEAAIEMSLREFSKEIRKIKDSDMDTIEALAEIAMSDDSWEMRLLAAEQVIKRMENSR